LYERYKPWLRQLVALRKKWELAHQKNDPKDIAAMKEALRETVEQLEAQLKEPPVFSADLQLAKELRELQESLRKALDELEQGDYNAVDNRLAEADEKAEKDLDLPLEMLTKLYRLIEDESLFTMLAQVQEDIAHRTQRFQHMAQAAAAQDQRDLKALAEEQRQVQSSLETVIQEIRDHAGKLPKDDPEFKELIDSANEFATKVLDMNIVKVLEDAASAMEKNAGTDSHTHAAKGAELMMSLVEKMNAQGGMAGGAMKKLRKFGPYIANTVNQLLGGKGLPGAGQSGSGHGGYSMSRGGNAGLYGNRPRKLQGKGSGGGEKGGGSGLSSGQKLDDVEGFGRIDQFDEGKSGGVPLSAIPSRYRSAVRDFNRRIADEGAK
jgi:hypothetical protein